MKGQSKQDRWGDRRRGSLMVEVAVAAALLAATIVAVGKLSVSASQLQTQSSETLAARLAAENVMEQIHGLSKQQIANSEDQLAGDQTLTCGCMVTIAVDENTPGRTTIVRATVKATCGTGTAQKMIRWWAPPVPSDSEPEPSGVEPESSKEAELQNERAKTEATENE